MIAYYLHDVKRDKEVNKFWNVIALSRSVLTSIFSLKIDSKIHFTNIYNVSKDEC